jgi:uncharacterized protein (DUF1501 family)
MVSRRFFLKGSALAMFGVGGAPAWLARAAAQSGSRRKVLVVVFQRGAADGLNIVVPYGESRYYSLRPAIHVPPPGSGDDAAVDLDGFFGLHPSLAPLKPLYEAKTLAIVEAVGSPDPTRSHFDAQDFMESGTPGRSARQDGWLNRALIAEPGNVSPLRAVSLGPELPLMLRGANPAVAVANLQSFRLPGPAVTGAFASMYADASDAALRNAGKETFEAMGIIQRLDQQPYLPSGGAEYPNGRLGQSLRQIARLIKANVGLEVAFAEIDGWDHHVNEVGANAAEGQLANVLREFGGSLAAFHADLGPRIEDVTLVTMSEFGRTAHENGDRGTDHGHANVMFVMGGGVRGGCVYGDWPGLADAQLYEGRDLALTTDFRDVLAELVVKRLGNQGVTGVFPGYAHPRFRNLLT